MYTVERLAELFGIRILVCKGIGHREWEDARTGDLPPVVQIDEGLSEDERADQVASALVEWYVGLVGWERVVEVARRLGRVAPALMAGFGTFGLLHVCAWDGAQTPLEQLLRLANYWAG